ncbi:MAG: hypothetical protein Q9217_002868 [Psora testacea]
MLIGLCGAKEQLNRNNNDDDLDASKDLERRFGCVESLLEFVTKRWEQRWVTTDIWDEKALDQLQRRPFFILLSVDAPVSLRWRRFVAQCEERNETPPSLETFVRRNDAHLYDHNDGLACLIDRAELRLVNQTSSIQRLHDTLKDLDLANNERLRPNWDEYFMQLASLAAHRSNCMKRRVGCVLVRERRVISTGYNGTPRNLTNCNEGGCARCNSGSAAGVSLSTLEKLGYTIEWIRQPQDIECAESLILPGVGHFGHCLTQLSQSGYLEPIRKHVESGKPFMGICVGLQALFEGSAENTSVSGLGIIPGYLARFDNADKSVPHIGWNSAAISEAEVRRCGSLYGLRNDSKYYYVHSYAVPYRKGLFEQDGWTVATARYGTEVFIGAIARRRIFATQFHPEKSGVAGLRVLKAFLEGQESSCPAESVQPVSQGLTRRVIACLDVRTNDEGDLVVTKGDQYDVRENASAANSGKVRNLGKPVDLARKYYEEGSDEITFLNITSFRNCPLADLPMLEILRRTSETVFVPLTIGGGIRDTTNTDGTLIPALDVATLYFQSGADKVSIGSDAVLVAEEYVRNQGRLLGKTAIETISAAYGNQAVIVSVDPKRVYVDSPNSTKHHTIKTEYPGPSGQEYCWYQCTIKGGREGRDLDVRQLVTAVEALGAGEILLNCIDKDGSNSGFDLELINDVKKAVKIPVIASSGAGNPLHFEEVFRSTSADAALGAGMFHRGEYAVWDVKDHLAKEGFLVRPFEDQI